jgi:probable HAF family extracellular repeat protein
MNSKTWTRIIALTLFAALTVTVPLAAQDKARHNHPQQYHHYQIIDPGTFGGPQSHQTLGGFVVGDLNNRGAFAGSADTSAIDPLCVNYPDCYAAHASLWQNGANTDLGLLPDGTNSQVNWISANGLMTGSGDNGQSDPLIGIPFQIHGMFWAHDGAITDIGALPGTYFSDTFAVNNSGQVVGVAMNTIPDPNSIWGIGYQTRAYHWKDGVMQDLGTLGTGTDAVAGLVNERGQVVGWSYTNATPTAACANINFNFSFALTTGSFIWDKHNGMRDIGGLGGTCTLASDLNNRGQIVGASSLAGDPTYHPFVWDAATGMSDLMGASNGFAGIAHAINDRGQIVGVACDAVACHAALWQKRGGKWQETDLGIFTVGGCPNATSVNASAQVVGNDYCAGLPFLSEDGATLVDLDTLVSPNSGLQFTEVGQINDEGEITVNGYDANGNNHSVVLIPCDENHPGVEGCDYDLIDAETAAARSSQNPVQHPEALTPGTRTPGMLNRLHFPRNRPTPGLAPAPGASLALSATPATGDLLDDHQLVPQFGTPASYCEIFDERLTGTCIQSTLPNTCQITLTGCNSGQPATLGSSVVCDVTEHWLSTTQCGSVPGFNVSTTGLTPTTVSAGGSATSTLTVAAYGGFGGSVAFSCSVQPASALAPTCLFSPRSVTSGTPSTLTVSTTAPTSALRTGSGSRLFYAFFLPLSGLFAMVLRFGPQQKRNGKFTAAVLACMLFAGVVFQAACGAKTPTPGTPPGSYMITVTGTDSSGTLAIPTTMVFYVQ